jgi:outer membrane protein
MKLNRMKGRVRAAAGWMAMISLPLAVTARADELEVRLRAIYLAPANASNAYDPLKIPENGIHINDKWLPDLDVEYFFTPHWSSELVLTYPQKQNVTLEHSALGGPTTIGTFKHLPPTLTAKYNFMPDQTFQPYLGAGVNVTSIMDVKLQVPTVGRLTLDRTSVGAAVQGGFDYRIAKSWYFNVDAKWLMLRSDVKLGDVKISRVRIDPVLLGVGFGYRFGGGS